MNFSNYRFTLDMQKSKTQASLPVHFGDTGNRFYITLTDGGNPYIIGDGCRVDICIKKPNGEPLINACIIENNALVRYDFNKNTASVEGIHKCELRLYSSEGRLITTPCFIMVVDQNIFYDDEIGTDEDFQKLNALNVIAKEEERRASEFERWEAEELRVLAEKNRVEAEESRSEAENERKEAETERASAEDARVLAENEREQKITVMEETLNTYSEQLSDRTEQIEANERQIEANKETLNAHSEQLSDHSEQLSDHEGRISYNEQQISTHTRQIAENAQEAYSNGARISDIERYLGGEFFVEDSAVSYEKTVPKNACEKAKIVSIGGMTYSKHSLISAKVKAINSVSPNLIPYPYDTMPTSTNGLILIHNEDGSITINGTASSDVWYLLGNVQAKKGDALTLTGCPKGGHTSVYRLYANARNANNVDIYADDLNDIGDGATHTVVSDEINYYIYINIANGKVCKNLTFKPMFYRGTNALPFATSGVVDRFLIPEAVQNEDGYGLGIDESRCNFITWYGSDVYFVRRAKEITVQSAEYVGWANEGYKNIDFYAFKMPSDYVSYKLDAFIMEGFKTTTSANWDSNELYGAATGRATEFEIWVGFPKGTPQDEAISAIVGKKIVYVLAEPEATNITDKMPKVNLISVLGGGAIIAENEYNDPVPFGIKYLVTYPKEAT